MNRAMVLCQEIIKYTMNEDIVGQIKDERGVKNPIFVKDNVEEESFSNGVWIQLIQENTI